MSESVRGRNDLWGALLLGLGVVLSVTAFAGVSLFQIGAVAFFVWLALARDKGWAWLPAAFFGFHVAGDLLDGRGGSLFFPLMVVAAGVLMLSKERLSKNATIGILLLLAVVGIASSNRDNPPEPPPDLSVSPVEIQPPADEQTALPTLEGRDLVIRSSDRDVRITRAKSGRGAIEDDHGFEIHDEADFLLVEADDGPGDFELTVPAESRVSVQTRSGHVTAVVEGFALDVTTVGGGVDVDLANAQRVNAETRQGTIEETAFSDLDADPKVLEIEGASPAVAIRTISGDISVEPA